MCTTMGAWRRCLVEGIFWGAGGTCRRLPAHEPSLTFRAGQHRCGVWGGGGRPCLKVTLHHFPASALRSYPPMYSFYSLLWHRVQRLFAAVPPQLGKSSNQSHSSYNLCEDADISALKYTLAYSMHAMLPMEPPTAKKSAGLLLLSPTST